MTAASNGDPDLLVAGLGGGACDKINLSLTTENKY